MNFEQQYELEKIQSNYDTIASFLIDLLIHVEKKGVDFDGYCLDELSFNFSVYELVKIAMSAMQSGQSDEYWSFILDYKVLITSKSNDVNAIQLGENLFTSKLLSCFRKTNMYKFMSFVDSFCSFNTRIDILNKIKGNMFLSKHYKYFST